MIDAREFIEKMLATRFLDDEDSDDPEKRLFFKKKTSGKSAYILSYMRV